MQRGSKAKPPCPTSSICRSKCHLPAITRPTDGYDWWIFSLLHKSVLHKPRITARAAAAKARNVDNSRARNVAVVARSLRG